MSAELNFNSDAEIDGDHLEFEVASHPAHTMEYGEKSAEADKAVEIAEEALKFHKAQLEKDVKGNPGAYGLGDKITEATVTAIITTDSKTRVLLQACIEARYQANLWRAACIAMGAKRTMLEALVKLHGQNYFSSPNTSGEKSFGQKLEEWKSERRDQARASIRESLNRPVAAKPVGLSLKPKPISANPPGKIQLGRRTR